MATLQICYKDSTGKVVCKDSSVQAMSTVQGGGDRPKRKDVKDAIGALVDAVLADTPEYFSFVYAPDGIQAPPTAG